MIIDEINQETEEYYNSLREGKGLKLLMRFSIDESDSLDSLLDSLKEKGPTLNLPDKEEDELTAWLREKTERQREMERKGKIKVRI